MRYKLLGQHTGLRVSELVQGTGMFGTKWGHWADPQESRRIFDGYIEAGGNFLDTSDSYQFGESLLGEFVKTMHDDLVLATKFTQRRHAGDSSVLGLRCRRQPRAPRLAGASGTYSDGRERSTSIFDRPWRLQHDVITLCRLR
jgi:aryl-alcohol dehydrogenase-like predicted oxidoreductase